MFFVKTCEYAQNSIYLDAVGKVKMVKYLQIFKFLSTFLTVKFNLLLKLTNTGWEIIEGL